MHNTMNQSTSSFGNIRRSSMSGADLLQTQGASMLVSPMTLMSISETERNAKNAFKRSGSIASSNASFSSSSESMKGWGSVTSRASYKVGLSELSDDAPAMEVDSSRGYRSEIPQMKAQPLQSSEELSLGDAWGYYVDTAAFR
mmetsp:Transcript_45524/g.138373  ORF Transcript_45524/g.138373 Transcript_45524/m.138373 type:complete len:143 (-) Transcript_45524:234-662(-)